MRKFYAFLAILSFGVISEPALAQLIRTELEVPIEVKGTVSGATKLGIWSVTLSETVDPIFFSDALVISDEVASPSLALSGGFEGRAPAGCEVRKKVWKDMLKVLKEYKGQEVTITARKIVEFPPMPNYRPDPIIIGEATLEDGKTLGNILHENGFGVMSGEEPNPDWYNKTDCASMQ